MVFVFNSSFNRRATAHHFLAEPYPFANQVFSLNQTRQKMTHRPPATLCFNGKMFQPQGNGASFLCSDKKTRLKKTRRPPATRE